MEIKTILFCWCDGTGIGHPMDVTKDKMFKCSKCKAEISVALIGEDGMPLSTEKPKKEVE